MNTSQYVGGRRPRRFRIDRVVVNPSRKKRKGLDSINSILIPSGKENFNNINTSAIVIEDSPCIDEVQDSSHHSKEEIQSNHSEPSTSTSSTAVIPEKPMNSTLQYFTELRMNLSTSLYCTADRWILVRAHVKNNPAKLSSSNYWIVNCHDLEMRQLHCSCKSFQCIHIEFIKSMVNRIMFPRANPSNAISSNINQSDNTSNNPANNDEKSDSTANQSSSYSIAILREITENHLMRRIFILTNNNNIDNQLNIIDGKPPVLVNQINRLPIDYSFWCRHCCLSQCQHTRVALKYCQEKQLVCSDFISSRDNRDFDKTISKKSIPIPKYLQLRDNNDQKPIELNSETILHERICQHCNITSASGDCSLKTLLVGSCSVYDVKGVTNCRVAAVKCSKCGNISEYDGVNDGVFNYNNKQLFTHSLLNLYTISYSAVSLPFNAFVLIANRYYREMSNSIYNSAKFVSNPTFLTVWCSFVKRQDWEFKFQCPLCGPNPPMIFCDGTSLSIQRVYAANLKTPTYVDPVLPIRTPTHLELNEIVCYSDEVRAVLKQFLDAIKMVNQQKLSQIMLTELPILSTNNRLDLVLPLYKFLQLVRFLLSQSQLRKLKLCSRLLSILSAKESLVALINPIVYQQYQLIINGCLRSNRLIPTELSLEFKNSRPLLYDLLDSFDLIINNPSVQFNYENHIKPTDAGALIEFLDSIMMRANEIHQQYDVFQSIAGPRLTINDYLVHYYVKNANNNSNNNNNNNASMSLAAVENVHSDFKEMINSVNSIPNVASPPTDIDTLKSKQYNKSTAGKFYASRPIYTVIQQYKSIDSKRNKSDNANSSNDSAKLVCQKTFPTRQKFSGGIMAFWCEHGISYGFHMIEKAEAQKDVMCALLMHWEKAPRVILYDNACHLMKYCHSREWEYFKNTTFLIDEFHQYNHTQCTEAHSMKQFKSSRAVKFLFKNCSVAESGNAGLNKLKASMHYLQADAAFIYTLIQLEIQNNIKTINLLRSINRFPALNQQECTELEQLFESELISEVIKHVNDSEEEEDVVEEDLE